MTKDKVTYVPTVVQWTENGKVKQRTVNIEEGFSFNFMQSNNKNYKATAYKRNGQMPLLSLSKEDAYALLGFSRMLDDSQETRNGNRVFYLDHQDLEAARNADRTDQVNFLTDKMIMTAGFGAKIAYAQFPTDEEGNKMYDQFRISHSDTKKISIFYSPSKK